MRSNIQFSQEREVRLPGLLPPRGDTDVCSPVSSFRLCGSAFSASSGLRQGSGWPSLRSRSSHQMHTRQGRGHCAGVRRRRNPRGLSWLSPGSSKARSVDRWLYRASRRNHDPGGRRHADSLFADYGPQKSESRSAGNSSGKEKARHFRKKSLSGKKAREGRRALRTTKPERGSGKCSVGRWPPVPLPGAPCPDFGTWDTAQRRQSGHLPNAASGSAREEYAFQWNLTCP